MLYKILEYPHQSLCTKCNLVTKFDKNLNILINNLYQTMYNSGGIGLAANQVNIQQRLFVMDLSEEKNQPQCLINPQISYKSGIITEQEGCLSFPGLYIDVARAQAISVNYLDACGKSHVIQAKQLQARCIQHELDHLDGITFINRLSSIKRNRALKSLSLIKKNNNSK